MPGTPAEDIPRFEVSSKPATDGFLVVRIAGELDISHEDEARNELQGAVKNADAGVVVDLTECEFIDSTGIGVFVEAQRTLSGDGFTEPRVALVVSEGPVLRNLTMCGVARTLVTCETREEALRRLA